jgi:hypothetical protein
MNLLNFVSQTYVDICNFINKKCMCMWEVWTEVYPFLPSGTVAAQTLRLYVSYECYGCDWFNASTAHHSMSS